MQKTLGLLSLFAFLISAISVTSSLTAFAAPAVKAARPSSVDTLSIQAARESASGTAEPWKGPSDPARFNLGVLTGMGVIDSHAGFALLGTASAKIVNRGFVPEINDSVSIETVLGPLFVYDTASFMYSLHLRWDFERDEFWTLYALGGVSGQITGDSLGNRFILFPRFGLGAIYRIHELFALRAEISRELIVGGVMFSF